MGVRALTLEGDGPRRFQAAAVVACLLVAAQILFAVHRDSLVHHAPQSCEYCLAAAVADDPNDLVVVLDAPSPSYADAARLIFEEVILDGAIASPSPRGPPLC